MRESNETKELIVALCKAQGEMRPARKTRVNAFNKSTYADISDVWEALRGPFTKNGLCVVQFLEFVPTTESMKGHHYVVTRISHTSGQFIESETMITTDKYDSQSFGKAATYAKRYALCALAGVSFRDDEDDDDGQNEQVQEKAQNYLSEAQFKAMAQSIKQYEGLEQTVLNTLGIVALEFLEEKHVPTVNNLITRRRNETTRSVRRDEAGQDSEVRKRPAKSSHSKTTVEQ